MNVSRAIVPAVLAAIGACAPTPPVAGSRPLIPQDGPRASIRVEYDGGVFHRRASAFFRVDQPAYVMVAHLGGDGVIRVIFPEDAGSPGLVTPRRNFRTEYFHGDYDAAPGYWFMRPAMYRTTSARHYSYDGRGHGFVFMIASSRPLNVDPISESGLWIEHEVPDYANTLDPRGSIRQFADLVAGGGKYTLDYATSFASQGVYSYAQSRMDCAMMSSAGFGMSLHDLAMVPWHSYGFGSSFLSGFGTSRCGSTFPSVAYAFTNGAFPMPGAPGRGPVISGTPRLPAIDIPAQRVPRPGRRASSEATPASTLTRRPFSTPARERWDREDRSSRREPADTRSASSPSSSSPSAGSAKPAPSADRPSGRQHERPTVKSDP